MQINIFLLFNFICVVNYLKVDSFNLKVNPLNCLDLVVNHSLEVKGGNVYDYPRVIEPFEKFKIVQIDIHKNFLVLGARNRIVTVNTNSFDKIQIEESFFPVKEKSLTNRNCSNRNCANYILSTLPIKKNEYNLLQCGTYFGIFQCMQSNQNKQTGLINFYDTTTHIKASKSLTLPFSSQNAYYLSPVNQSEEYIMYAASSWTDSSQYLAVHSSEHYYQENDYSKKIGVSKSFVRFMEDNNRLFLFQNEYSYDIDDGEKDRDILISTSLVSQICKGKVKEFDTMSKETAFYSELTAKIYCFNDNFRKGNSRNFKFDSLEFVTDFINLNGTRKVFYAAFNTPKNQITGAAICFFDISDISDVFQKKNFQYLEDNNEFSAKNSPLNPQDCDADLSYSEKLKYKSFTSKLRYMTKAALPIRKRKASFITTNEYRITCLHLIDNMDESKMQPSIKRFDDKYSNLNIILAGTDNGKLMRIAHYFSNEYFENDNYDEENVVILEEIQLFGKNTSINEISILNNGNSKQIIAVSGHQIKSISIDFCVLYSESCEKCLKSNINTYYSSQCYWSNNSCQSKLKLDFNRHSNHSIVNNFDKCSVATNFPNTTKTLLRIKTFNSTAKSSFNKNVTSFLRNQPSKTISITLSDANILYNLPKFTTAEKQSLAKAQTFGNENKLTNMNIYITISIIGSIFGLLIGLLAGFIIKTNYSKKILSIISNKFLSSQTQKSIKNKPETTNSELELAVEDIIVRERGHAANFSNTKTKTNLECISHSSNSDESFGSTKSTSCCNENCVHNRSTSGSTNSERVSDIAVNSSNPPLNCTYTKEKEYFTIQKDYDNYTSKITQDKKTLKVHSQEPPKNVTCNRFSSLSSSTDSSSYGLYNVAHHQNNHTTQVAATSQICLLPPQKLKVSPTLGGTTINKNTISFIDNDYSRVYGKTTLPPPTLFRQQQQQNHPSLYQTNSRPRENFNKRFSSISFSSTGLPESTISSAHTVISPPHIWGAPSSTMSKQEIYYKNHHIRKQNSVYRPAESTSLKNSNSNASSSLTSDQKMTDILMRVNNNITEDAIKKVNISDIMYKNNSYV